MRIHKLVFIVLLSALSACSSLTPWRNPPLPPGTPDTGVDTARLTERTDPSFVIIVSISGGGARAAAFGYGVLKELADTQIRWNGQTQTLLSQVDVVRGVSGGSIVAAYYALNGSKTFPAFKNEYLYKDFQQSLVSAIFSPQILPLRSRLRSAVAMCWPRNWICSMRAKPTMTYIATRMQT
ncbi:patatin-like phospholipase family protein [Advenella kashmirensis]|uniref:patatin-like phospholipase family protein n=1 Tax=Advenella kashmirensis TaxID=310575 RepID=UPI0006829294|nr:patatin-like phospholipase family protein [Advenella kashmirensis]